MILTHKIRLDTTEKQESYFVKAAGATRFVWNWALAEWNRQYESGGKPNGMSLKRQFNAIKYNLFPWLKEIHRDAHSDPFSNLQKAFVRFFKKLNDKPKFKTKRRSKESFQISNDRIRFNGMKVRMPVLGWVRMTESLRLSGRVMSATVTRTAGCWYISINVDVGDVNIRRVANGFIGVDLGIKNLAVTSNGEWFESPKPLAKNLPKLKRLQQRLTRKEKGSTRSNKLKNRIARLHERIRNIRQDCLHKLTTKLCRENQAVVIEDLCVEGMLRNRKLSRAISDVGWGELRRQLDYKSKLYGVELILANRFYPSSKTCSGCKSVKESLPLSEREFRCDHCGMQIDRDLNAALNLHAVGLTAFYARGSEGSGERREAITKPCRVETRTKTRANLISLLT